MEATIDPTATGWERREIMVDARDIKRDGLTEAQYKAALVQRGTEKLAEYGIVECLEAVTLPNVNFTYKTDYDLGDVVTVNKKAWGIKMDKRITEAVSYTHLQQQMAEAGKNADNSAEYRDLQREIAATQQKLAGYNTELKNTQTAQKMCIRDRWYTWQRNRIAGART